MFDQGVVRLTLQPGPTFDVDAIDLEPLNNPTNIDDVISQNKRKPLRTLPREILQQFHITFTWADQAIGGTNGRAGSQHGESHSTSETNSTN